MLHVGDPVAIELNPADEMFEHENFHLSFTHISWQKGVVSKLMFHGNVQFESGPLMDKFTVLTRPEQDDAFYLELPLGSIVRGDRIARIVF